MQDDIWELEISWCLPIPERCGNSSPGMSVGTTKRRTRRTSPTTDRPELVPVSPSPRLLAKRRTRRTSPTTTRPSLVQLVASHK